MKQTKLTKSARDEECTFQIHPYCIGSTDTTVLCHINSPDKGMSTKSPDWWAAYGCRNCHDIVDGRWKVELQPSEIIECIYRGIYRTHKRLIEKGLIKIS